MIFPRLKTDGSLRREDSWRASFLFFVLSVFIFTLAKLTPVFNGLQYFSFQFVYSPLRIVIYTPLRGVAHSWQDLNLREERLQQFFDLKVENDELRAQLQRLSYYQAENRRLRLLMESVATVSEPVMVAEIVDDNIEGYRETILINRGTAQGVYIGQSVIDPYGLVGQVIEVYPYQARVMLISDGRSRVPVYVERTKQRALLTGDGDMGVVRLENVVQDSDIVVGDRLLTSGLGGIFPRGYLVAEVVAVERNQRQSFLSVRLRPMAQLRSMLEVLLLDQRGVFFEGDSRDLIGPPFLDGALEGEAPSL